jgi:hypothetical protein
VAAKHWLGWVGSALVAVNLSGCAMMSWDDLTSREFSVHSLWTAPQPPLTVIAKSSDGYARSKALNKLDEPSNPALLEQHIEVLQAAAMNDRDPLCRLAALRTLGRYKDPRAARILSDVYLSDPPMMSTENKAFIRQQALTSLQVSSPVDARQLFIQAARQPSGSLTGAAQRDRMEILDERLTAIRALGKYPQADAVDTLVKLLETEKDIAIRKCAHESLVASTKQDIPPDGNAWREFVSSGRLPPRQNNGMLASLIKTNPLPTPAPASNGPGVFDTISNWVRPEKAPAQTVSNPTPSFPTSSSPPLSAPPQNAPISNSPPLSPPAPNRFPAVPNLMLTPNQVRNNAPPAGNDVLPAGATRNAQGEMIVPVTP